LPEEHLHRVLGHLGPGAVIHRDDCSNAPLAGLVQELDSTMSEG
jgi:hypothetical protein